MDDDERPSAPQRAGCAPELVLTGALLLILGLPFVWLSARLDAQALHRAARRGDRAAIERLLDDGLEVDARLRWRLWSPGGGRAAIVRRTALHWASEGGQAEVARLLIERGAAVEARDERRDTPLMLAASLGRTEVVAVLLEAGASVDPPLDDPHGPFALALAANHFDRRPFLLMLEHLSRSRDPRGLVERVLEYRTDRFSPTPWAAELRSALGAEEIAGATPPMLAVRYGTAEDLRRALRSGADLDARDELGWTALHWAASSRGSLEELEVLIDAGADVNAAATDGWTPLMAAVLEGDGARVQRLIEAGADVDATCAEGRSAMDAARRAGQAEIVHALALARRVDELGAKGR